MRLSARATLLVIIGAVLLGGFVDRTIVVQTLPSLSRVLLIRPGLTLFGVPFFQNATFGVIPSVGVPLIAVGILLIPFRQLTTGAAWSNAWTAWKRIAVAVLAIPAGMLLGGFAYQLVAEHVPKTVAPVLTAFGLKPTFFFWSDKSPIVGPLDGSLASICGAWLALYWVSRRMRRSV